MKKYLVLLFAAFVMVGCGGYIKNENGSEHLKQLDGEPIGCVFLYKIESEVSVYDQEDARRYLENRIVDQARPGNAYWIVSERTKPNEWVVFGPERSFIFSANVYDCPNVLTVRTARSDKPMPEYEMTKCESAGVFYGVGSGGCVNK